LLTKVAACHVFWPSYAAYSVTVSCRIALFSAISILHWGRFSRFSN